MKLTNEEKYKLNKQNWTWVRNLTREEKEEKGYSQAVRGLYKCNSCGERKDIINSNFKRRLTVCDNGCHGVGQDSNQFIVGVNDMATTHPQLEVYFIDKEEMKRIKACSNYLAKLTCPHCGFQKEMLVYNLTNRGFSCPCCSDGFSTPEKFVANILYELKIEFKKEYSFGDGRRYDFYVPSLNMIIETHGVQHYTGSFGTLSGKGLEYEQENDKQKRIVATNYGVTHYIELDCRESNFNYLLNSIYNSPLNELLELDRVNWEEVKKRMASSTMLEVIEYFNTHNASTKTIAREFKIGSTSVARYLVRGTELGLCDYQKDGGAKARAYKERSNKTIMVKDNQVVRVEDSALIMSKVLGFSSSSRICELCKGEGKYGHFTKSSKLGGRVGFYHLDSEDWKTVKHLYTDENGLLDD